MPKNVAIIGGGVSGLTCGVLFAESGWRVTLIAREIGQATTSGAAGAIWFPYDAEPFEKVLPWSLTTFGRLRDLAANPASGVSMIELRQFARTDQIPIPDWATKLGARRLDNVPRSFSSGFALTVPLTDTTIYLDYLIHRFRAGGGMIEPGNHIDRIDEIDERFALIVNCTGIGARELTNDCDLEPHRGQVAIVPPLDLHHAIVCDDSPLMYVIPRARDCVFGGTNQVSDDLSLNAKDSAAIIAECSGVLNIPAPAMVAQRVGLRPFRKTGVRLELDQSPDRRPLIHNYGHGGAGFTLSFGCAKEVLKLAQNL